MGYIIKYVAVCFFSYNWVFFEKFHLKRKRINAIASQAMTRNNAVLFPPGPVELPSCGPGTVQAKKKIYYFHTREQINSCLYLI